MGSPTAAVLLRRTDRTGYLQVIPRGIIISKDNACHYSSINHPDAARQLAYPQCQFAARSCESAAAGCLMPPSLRGRTEGPKSSSCPAARYRLTAVTRRWGCAASELERGISLRQAEGSYLVFIPRPKQRAKIPSARWMNHFPSDPGRLSSQRTSLPGCTRSP